jgi:cell division protein FtsX
MWIERHRHLLDYAVSSLARRKWRHIGLTLVFTLMIFVLGSVVLFAGALQREASMLLESAPDIVVQRAVAGRQVFIPVRHAAKLQSIRGVRSVTPRLWGYYAHPVNGNSYTITAPPEFSHQAHEIVVGEGVARTWGSLEAGRLFFSTHDRRGILLDAVKFLPGDTGLVSSDLILMSESAFRQVSGLPAGFAADLAVRVRNPREIPTVAGKIARILPDALPVLKEDIQRTYQAGFAWRSGLITLVFLGAGMAFFIFAWEKASAIGGKERSEIGTLKALGWHTGDILAVKFWESAVISLTAFLAGTTLAYIHVFMMSAPLLAPVLLGWSTLYPRFDLPPEFPPGELAVLFLGIVVPYTLATVIPAWRVATLPPDTAMRQA